MDTDKKISTLDLPKEMPVLRRENTLDYIEHDFFYNRELTDRWVKEVGRIRPTETRGLPNTDAVKAMIEQSLAALCPSSADV